MADRISRLPQWAQEHISRLERQCVEADERVAQVCGTSTPDPSAAVLDFYGVRPAIQLPRGNVRFPLHGISISVDAEGELTVFAEQHLMIAPRSANTALVVSVGRAAGLFSKVAAK